MTKHWLKTYDAGVPETINADAYPSIVSLFEDSAARYADLVAFECFGQT
ncbi:hypothetical protein JQV47_18745, partial [Sulfitobacter mediterraneus]|nr:hypothetical protein [Sulfitobacter mediterraneus]